MNRQGFTIGLKIAAFLSTGNRGISSLVATAKTKLTEEPIMAISKHTSDHTGDGNERSSSVSQDAEEITRDAGERVKQRVEAGQRKAGQELDAMSEVIDATAAKLSEQDKQGLATYARQLSEKMSQIAEKLQQRSIDDLAEDAKNAARSNPALFIFGSIALGFGLARFMKASDDRVHDTTFTTEYSGSSQGMAAAAQNPPASTTVPSQLTPTH